MSEPARNIVPFRSQAEWITRENLIGRKTTDVIHFNMGRKGGAWSFGVEGIPRLTAWRDRTGTTWAVDGKTMRNLDTALAVLNGVKTLEEAIKEAEQIIPPQAQRPGKVSLDAQIAAVDATLDELRVTVKRVGTSNLKRHSELEFQTQRMQAVRSTLVWLKENETAIKQRMSY